MRDKKVRMTIEFSIDGEKLEETNLTADKILNSITVNDSDVIDGFEIYPTGLGDDICLTSDFFLNNARIIFREIV